MSICFRVDRWMSEGWSTWDHHTETMTLTHTHIEREIFVVKSKQSDKCEKWHCLQVAKTGGVSQAAALHVLLFLSWNSSEFKRQRKKNCAKKTVDPLSLRHTLAYTPTKKIDEITTTSKCVDSRRITAIHTFYSIERVCSVVISTFKWNFFSLSQCFKL